MDNLQLLDTDEFDRHMKNLTNFFNSLRLHKKLKEKEIVLINALRDSNSVFYTSWPLLSSCSALRNTLFEKLDEMKDPSAGFKNGINIYGSFLDEKIIIINEE